MSDTTTSTSSQIINGESLRLLEEEKLVTKTDTDSNSKLDVFCYNNYEAVVKYESTDIDKFNQLIQTRGVVVDSESGRVVVKSFPFSSEHVSEPPEEVMLNIGRYRMFDSHEGTMIRVFNHANNWHISTNRKLNAFMSKWSSQTSYGLMFKYALEHEMDVNDAFKRMLGFNAGDNIIDKFKKCLDKSKQYVFLVKNSIENRIVCIAPEKYTVYHVGTYVNGELSLDDDIKIRKPEEHMFKTPSELVDHVVNKVKYRQIQGIIMIGPIGDESKMRCYKVYNPDYEYYYKIRGSTTSLRYRYLQLRTTKEVEALVYINQDSIPMFDECETIISDHVNMIFSMYKMKYMFKEQNVKFKPADFDLIKKVHSWYITGKTEGRRRCNVTIDVIYDFVSNSHCSYLNKIIKDRKYADRKNGNVAESIEQEESAV